MTDAKTFDPGRYLSKVGSADYLEVKWRLVWLREIHPDATITTELVSHSDQMAIFRAFIQIPNGGGASGYGSEGYSDFREYIEKAETKAIGRACAALGFGTQFCPDFEHGGFVDTPVDRSKGAGGTLPDRSRGTTANTVPGTKPTIQNPNAAVSPNQLNYIKGLAKQLGMTVVGPDGEDHTDDQALDVVLQSDYDTSLAAMTMGQASEVIEGFKDRLKRKAQQGELIPNGRDYTR